MQSQKANERMNKIHATGAKVLNLMKAYPISLCGGFRNRRLFEDVEIYCMFIGYSRSGKTLVSSLLDAHPNMIIADQLGALMYIHAGFSQKQIYYLLIEKSQAFTRAGRRTKWYSYQVSNQWQGKFRKLLVIGDNHGEGATLRLRERPWLLRRLRNAIGGNMRFIHVIRNPYDNISDLVTQRRDLKLDLRGITEYYFSLCETITDIKRQVESSELFELRYESLVKSPEICLEELCYFLGAGASNDYLNDCASILFESPHKSRYSVQWSRELIDIVEERMEHFSFLHGYSYES